jgi:WD40 repeat protein
MTVLLRPGLGIAALALCVAAPLPLPAQQRGGGGGEPHLLVGKTLIDSLAVSPDGRLIAVGEADRQIRVWDFPNRALKHVLEGLEGHAGKVNHLAFTADGKHLVSVSLDPDSKGAATRAVRWDAATGRREETFVAPGSPLALSPNGQVLVTRAIADRTVMHVVNRVTKEKVTLKGHEGEVLFAAVSPDGRLVATAEEYHTVRVWDLPAGKQRLALDVKFGSSIRGLFFSANGKTLGVGLAVTQLWDMPSGKLKAKLRFCIGEAFSPDGKLVASRPGGGVELWSVSKGESVGALFAPEARFSVRALSFSPDGRFLAAGGSGGKVYVWQLPRPVP